MSEPKRPFHSGKSCLRELGEPLFFFGAKLFLGMSSLPIVGDRSPQSGKWFSPVHKRLFFHGGLLFCSGEAAPSSGKRPLAFCKRAPGLWKGAPCPGKGLFNPGKPAPTSGKRPPAERKQPFTQQDCEIASKKWENRLRIRLLKSRTLNVDATHFIPTWRTMPSEQLRKPSCPPPRIYPS